MKTPQSIKIGTRRSPLAIRQAEYVQQLISKTLNHSSNETKIEICLLTTSGDKFTDRPLAAL